MLKLFNEIFLVVFRIEVTSSQNDEETAEASKVICQLQ